MREKREKQVCGDCGKLRVTLYRTCKAYGLPMPLAYVLTVGLDVTAIWAELVKYGRCLHENHH